MSYNVLSWFSKIRIELWEGSQLISELSNLEKKNIRTSFSCFLFFIFIFFLLLPSLCLTFCFLLITSSFCISGSMGLQVRWLLLILYGPTINWFCFASVSKIEWMQHAKLKVIKINNDQHLFTLIFKGNTTDLGGGGTHL